MYASIRHLIVFSLITISIWGISLAETNQVSVIPKPVSLQLLKGEPQRLDKNTRILYEGKGAKDVALLLSEMLRSQSSKDAPLPFPVEAYDGKKTNNTISLIVSPQMGKLAQSPEGYTFFTTKGHTTIQAATSRGLFNATQTLLQLLPAPKYPTSKISLTLPAVKIHDAPAYKWRGMMLDVSRYFFTKKYVLRYLDMMAMHKMNVLHWHLIDDAGWRIEIKKYPKLTEIGAWRGTGKNRYGGFYTQKDIREIVAYAAARNITIVPEIELPAHTLPALAAYPHLGCFGRHVKVPNRHFISRDLYCAGKETTWKFLEDVFSEVCDLFPGTYIHIGGDEAIFTNWNKCPDCQKKIKELHLKSSHELQGWMTTRIEKFLKTKGKRIIGWDEILGAGVSNQAGIMTWHRPETAAKGARRGNPVVMSLTSHAYFDVGESRLPGEPPTATWIRPISLEKAYNWTPTPKGLDPEASKNILGASGCVWTDQFLHNAKILADKPGKGTQASEDYVDYLSLPRMAALAEVTWTPEKLRKKGGFSDFKERMRTQYLRYIQRGYHFRIPVPEITIKKQTSPKKQYILSATPAILYGSIRYTTDGSIPTKTSPQITSDGKTIVDDISQLKAATFTPDLTRRSILFQPKKKSNRFAKYGKSIGSWKSGKIGNKSPIEVTFDATGHINKNGTYLITFLYTGGQQRLDIDGIRVVRNDTTPAGKDIHHGFTGTQSKNNTYKVKITNYQTGASFKIKAMIYGDEGNDSNGQVFIRRAR